MNSNNSRRANNQGTVTISMPKALIEKLDAEAAKEHRTRSGLIVHRLMKTLKPQETLRTV